MAKTFHLTIATVGKNLFDGEALSATVPGKDGVFHILADHEALVSQIVPGSIRVTASDGTVSEFRIDTEGVAEVSRHQATILL